MAYKTNYGDITGDYSSKEKSKIVVVPVPYDGTSTWVKGADKGPEAIVNASAHMELYDIETDSSVYEQGIFTDEPVKEKGSPEKMVDAVHKRAAAHLKDGKFVVVLGGEHSVSVGTIKAHAEKYKNMSVLQLDAHSDLRPEYEGSKYNHACAMARVKEFCPVTHVGIRSMDSDEKECIDMKRVFFAEKIHGKKDWMKDVVSQLSENVYVTVDLDVFDSSLMPATGTPEPGGMLWYDVIELLKAVAEKKNVVGFDVVELCPIECNKAPDFVAAKLVYKLLSYKFAR